MKKTNLIAALVFATVTAFGQTVDLRRKIDVNGSAEKEVTPDIITVAITLKEFMDGKNKTPISQLENQLETAVSEAGIPKGDLTIDNLSSYNYPIQKRKDPGFLASKQYIIKFHDLNRFDQIISKIDARGIQSTNISSYEYSKINELKNELKLKALLAARDKAAFLLNGIGEKLGSAIEITENDDVNYPVPRPVMFMAKTLAAPAETPESDIDVKKIKLTFQVHAVFEIGK